MSDNVIYLPENRYRPKSGDEEPRPHAQDIAKQREEEEQYRRDQAYQILERLKLQPRSKKTGDHEQVAANLAAILDEAVGEGATKLQILRAAGLARAGKSTKRLFRYTLPSHLVGEARSKRIANLTQRLNDYVKLARAVAAALGRDERYFILRTLRRYQLCR